MKFFTFFSLIVYVLIGTESFWLSEPTITTPLGKIVGSLMYSASGRRFQSFRGIPYAQPPVDKLRFKEPVYVTHWGNGTLDARQEGPACIQYDSFFTKMIRGKEDCLKLNIYTHAMKPEKLRPVMVWIHGGAFMMGSGNGDTDFYGPEYFLDKDIVLVTINYRLDVFGFISTEDSEAPGNYGLLDQATALKWVHNNIQHFGGDPNSVTIFGQSAGGASVEFQILSPYSKGLFHRAIAQSGSSMCPWSLKTDVGNYTKQLAIGLNCRTKTSHQILRCLRSKTAREILNYRKKMKVFKNFSYPLAFGPRIDIERKIPFISHHPKVLIERKQFNHVSYITGATANEAGFIVAELLSKSGRPMEEFRDNPIKFMRYSLAYEHREDGERSAERVVYHHLNASKPLMKQLPQIEQMLSDVNFFKCIDDSADLFRRYNEKSSYHYHYTHRAHYSLSQLIGAPVNIDFGVGHADELVIMFPNMLFTSLTSYEDIRASQALVGLWTSFASEGVPQTSLVPRWLPMTSEKRYYLNFNSRNHRLEQGAPPYKERLSILNQVLTYPIN